LKRFLVPSLIACSIIGAVALTTGGPTSAAVRHLRINHSPAPPLRTMEISSGAPATAACTNCPQNIQPNCTGCPGPVQITLLQVPLH
jgi:hypothetical protein